MVYRRIGKRLGCKRLPPRTLTITKRGVVVFSRDLIKKFKDATAIDIYVDTDYGKLAFQPTNDNQTGYKMLKRKRSPGRTIQSSVLTRTGIHGTFSARFTEGKIVVEGLKIKEEDLFFEEDI